MASLRDGLERAKFIDQPTTAIQQVALRFGLNQPVSVRRLIQLLRPETITWNVASATTDHVQGSATLLLESTGRWNFTGTMKDKGDGAKFSFVIALNHTDVTGMPYLFGETKELEDDQEYHFAKSGRSAWISKNWDGIRSSGYRWAMKSSTSASFAEIWEGIKVAVEIVSAIYSAVNDGEGGDASG